MLQLTVLKQIFKQTKIKKITKGQNFNKKPRNCWILRIDNKLTVLTKLIKYYYFNDIKKKV